MKYTAHILDELFMKFSHLSFFQKMGREDYETGWGFGGVVKLQSATTKFSSPASLQFMQIIISPPPSLPR